MSAQDPVTSLAYGERGSVTRAETFTAVSPRLASMDDQRLAAHVESSERKHVIRGEASVSEVKGRPAFVNRVPLTDLERRPYNAWSTANVFDLPPFFHYRIGSPGLG